MAPRTYKRFVQFQPSALVPLEECERYYSQVHTVWAMRTLREIDSVLSYETSRVLAQLDLLGGFERTPDAWRFLTLRTRDRAPFFTEAQAQAVARDHRRQLRDLRSFEVTERRLFDAPSDSLGAVKYLITVDRPESMPTEQAAEQFQRLGQTLAEQLASAYGARRLVSNAVDCERAAADGEEPAQVPTATVVPSTRVGFLELWFDDPVWAGDFFGTPAIRDLLVESAFAPAAVSGYRVTERISIDERT